jgi:hypothetical protein
MEIMLLEDALGRDLQPSTSGLKRAEQPGP